MLIRVKPDYCEGHGRCEATAPELFRLGDNDEVEILNEHPTGDLIAKARLAIIACPRNALELIED